MRYLLSFFLIFLFSFSAFADIIVTKRDGNIENVTVVEITDTEVIYTQKGTHKSIPYENVEAILYDDGRYVTLPSKSQTYSNSENNTSVSTDSYSRIPKDVDRQKVNENNDEKRREYEEKERELKEKEKEIERKIVNENNSDKKRELEKEREELKEKAKEFKNAWRDYFQKGFQKVKEAFKIKKTDSNTKDSPSSQPDSDNNW